MTAEQTAAERYTERIEAQVDELARVIAAATDEHWFRRPGPEEWTAAEVCGHVAEMLPYWAEQAELVAANGGGVPFGRVKSDPARIAAIERDRRDDPDALLDRIDQGVERVLALLDRLSPADLAQTGSHQTRGEMTVARIIDEFIVEHLEEHAEQIERAG